MTGASLSPGLAAMTARLGAAAPFAKASDLLAEPAGITLSTNRIERAAEAGGNALLTLADREAAAVLAGEAAPLPTRASAAKLYIAMDGTGVPMVPTDTTGRAGKAADGRARTREVKLAVLFTQTGMDEKGHPVRTPGSSSYLATLQPVEHLGDLLYAEARRRDAQRAERLVVLGDGAPWTCKLADKHFPHATQIVDLYHAHEHLHAIGALVAPALHGQGTSWLTTRLIELDHDDVPALLAATRELALPDTKTGELDKALGYFQTNTERMRYAHSRDPGHFIGSGAVETGCKAVIGQRLKLFGML